MGQNNRFSTDNLSNGDKKVEQIIANIIFRHVKDMVFIMKVERKTKFRYVFANESGLDKAGITQDSLGKLIEEVLPLEKALYLQQEYESLVIDGKEKVFSDEIKLENGITVFGETILTPVRDSTGVIQYVVAVTRDVTANLLEKHRLIESEQHYRSIVDHNLDAIFSLNLDGEILEANPAAYKLSGFPEGQLMYKHISNLIPPADLSNFIEVLHQTKQGYALETLDFRIIHYKGQSLVVHIKTVPIVINNEIKGIYIIIRDITEQTKHAESLKYMAFHDQLTGLLNRRALLEDLGEGIAEANKSEGELALLTIDLDRFKHLNDTLGHLIGDEILKKVAERLSGIQANLHYIYRQGGDEFNIILHGTSRQEVAKFAEKILANFNKSFYIASHEYYISPSIGISMYPGDGNTPELLIKNADEALYRVKERGKAHYQFYCSEMNTVNNKVSLETYLRKALDRGEFVLHYQPQINLFTQQVASFEALLRWNSNELGLVSPGEFIPLAEETGLIIPLGNWVIETACKQIREWNDKGYTNIRIAVNISPKQFQQTSLVNLINTMLVKYKIKASALEIEITEGTMGDKNETIPILRDLKALGVTISVDDFGTGYSSLSYLKQFPLDVLKIDQTFVKDIMSSEKDAAITSTIIHLGRSLGLEVIAEGVEEPEQVEFLLKAKCHKAQGFYFARPLPVVEIENLFLTEYAKGE